MHLYFEAAWHVLKELWYLLCVVNLLVVVMRFHTDPTATNLYASADEQAGDHADGQVYAHLDDHMDRDPCQVAITAYRTCYGACSGARNLCERVCPPRNTCTLYYLSERSDLCIQYGWVSQC